MLGQILWILSAAGDDGQRRKNAVEFVRSKPDQSVAGGHQGGAIESGWGCLKKMK